MYFPDMTEQQKKGVSNSVLWSAIERFSVQGIQFILNIIIARLVTPTDYGLIAMLGIFLAIAQTFIDSGFSNALIQKQDRNETDYSTVFYFNILVGIATYLILFLSSPYIAGFYHEPQLEIVTKVVGLNLVINSFTIVQRAKLIIELNFKLQAILALTAVITSGIIGVYLAYNGLGVWALVFQALLNNLLNSLLLVIFTKWKPKRIFSYSSFKHLFSFGSKLLAGALLHTVYMNSYTLIIGRFFSPSDLGFFNRANTIAQYVSTNFTNIISRVTYPIECKIQNDNRELQDKFFLFLRMATFVIFPLMVGVCVLAEPLVRLVLTDKWIPAIPYLQIMCVAYMWDPVQRMSWDLLNVKRRSDYSLKSEIIKKIVAFGILFATCWSNIYVMCWGLVLYALIDIFIITQFTKRLLEEVNYWQVLKKILPNLILSALMGGAVYFVSGLFSHIWEKILYGFLTGVIFYAGCSFLLGYKEIKLLVTTYLKK